MIPEISVKELAQKLSKTSPKPFLVDVREIDEVGVSALPFDLHIPLGEFTARYQEIPTDREVIVYCKAGGRSAKATGFLLQNGFSPELVRNLSGGMMQWAAEIEPGIRVA